MKGRICSLLAWLLLVPAALAQTTLSGSIAGNDRAVILGTTGSLIGTKSSQVPSN